MTNKQRGVRSWKESAVHLSKVTALTMDGPGDEWLMIVRGQRRPAAASTKRARQNRK